MKLTIEMVPRTSWYSNLRSELPRKSWDILRKACYKKAGNVCEICGGVGPKWPVEAHEIWNYDMNTGTQTLLGLQAICPDCHQCKHLGLAKVRGNFEEAKEHLATINNLTEEETQNYIDSCFDIWEERSNISWKLNLEWLDTEL